MTINPLSFNQFPDYQSLEPGSKGSDGKANRSIPDRIKEYRLMDIVKPHFDVLDIGCNRGYFGVALSPYIKSYTGIDSDENQIKEGLKLKPNNSTLINGKFKKMDRKFHVILCLAVHSYLYEDMAVLANDLVDMLQDGGFIFIESHPPGYREEPVKYLNPFIANLKKYLSEFQEIEVIDRDLKRKLYILFNGRMGTSSYVKITPEVVTKYYLEEPFFSERSLDVHFKNEARALAMFNGAPHFPKLINVDYVNHVIKMEYCGERMEKLPENFGHQAWEIETIMEREGFYHLDIKKENLLIKNGVITLIDWGLCTRNSNEYVNKLKSYVV